MKKIITLFIAMAIMACAAQAKSYDKLKEIFSDKAITYDTCVITNQITNDELKVYVNKTTEYGNWKRISTGNQLRDLNNRKIEFVTHHTVQQEIVIPKVIYDEYQLGTRLYKGGVATISIAAPIILVGAICYCNHSETTKIAGSFLLAGGATVFSCSIPLLCFGDHLKRTANKDFVLHNYF